MTIAPDYSACRAASRTCGLTTFSGREPLRQAATCRAVRERRLASDSSETNAACGVTIDAGMVPGGLAQIRRLGILHVEARAGQSTLVQSGRQSSIVDQSAASRIDEICRGLHAGQLIAADQMPRFGRQRSMQRDIVALGQ